MDTIRAAFADFLLLCATFVLFGTIVNRLRLDRSRVALATNDLTLVSDVMHCSGYDPQGNPVVVDLSKKRGLVLVPLGTGADLQKWSVISSRSASQIAFLGVCAKPICPSDTRLQPQSSFFPVVQYLDELPALAVGLAYRNGQALLLDKNFIVIGRIALDSTVPIALLQLRNQFPGENR